MGVTTGPNFTKQANAIGMTSNDISDVVGAFPANEKSLGRFGTWPYTFKSKRESTKCSVTYKKSGDDWLLTDIKKA